MVHIYSSGDLLQPPYNTYQEFSNKYYPLLPPSSPASSLTLRLQYLLQRYARELNHAQTSSISTSRSTTQCPPSIRLPDGSEVNVRIPEGLKPGDEFIFEVSSMGEIANTSSASSSNNNNSSGSGKGSRKNDNKSKQSSKNPKKRRSHNNNNHDGASSNNNNNSRGGRGDHDERRHVRGGAPSFVKESYPGKEAFGL